MAQPARPKVYISSTLRDLHEYRQAAMDTCRNLDFEPLVLEDFEATERAPLELLTDQMERADVFVGIYAHRYGQVRSELNEKSYIEFEFEQAAKINLPRLSFLLDANAPWPPGEFEKENVDRLKEFRERILNQVSIYHRITAPK